MDRRLNMVLLAAGLVVYILAVAALAVHYRFPYHRAALAGLAQLHSSTPVRVTFRGPEPGLPLITKAENVDLGWVANKENHTLLFFEQARFRLQPLRLLTGRLGLGFQAQAGKGRVAGRLSRRLMGQRDFEIHVVEMDLPDFALAIPGGRGRVEGRLTGRVDLTGQNRLDGIAGTLAIAMGPGRLTELNLPDMPLTELDFDTFSLEARLEKGRLAVEKCQMTGPQGSMTLNGQVRNIMSRPLLELAGTAYLGPAEKPMMRTTFRISGSPANPRVQVSGDQGRPGFPSQPSTSGAKD
jgi:type II secretion system protein N